METTTLEFKHLKETLDRFGDFIKTKYQTYVPEATGHLVDNVTFRVNHRGTQYEVILNLPFYYKFVEDGRKAGKRPPIEPILEWIKAKPVIPREIDGNLPTEKQLAFLIARSIGENGTQGKHVLRRAKEESVDMMLESIKQAFLEDIGEDMDKVLMLLR